MTEIVSKVSDNITNTIMLSVKTHVIFKMDYYDFSVEAYNNINSDKLYIDGLSSEYTKVADIDLVTAIEKVQNGEELTEIKNYRQPIKNLNFLCEYIIERGIEGKARKYLESIGDSTKDIKFKMYYKNTSGKYTIIFESTKNVWITTVEYDDKTQTFSHKYSLI